MALDPARPGQAIDFAPLGYALLGIAPLGTAPLDTAPLDTAPLETAPRSPAAHTIRRPHAIELIRFVPPAGATPGRR